MVQGRSDGVESLLHGALHAVIAQVRSQSAKLRGRGPDRLVVVR